MVVKALVTVALASLAVGGCVPHAAGRVDGPSSPRVEALTHGAELTVVEFFSARCPCQRAHDARLRALAEAFAPSSVRFVAVDAEADATPARDDDEARARGYPFPLISDPGGGVADQLGAQYATFVVILDQHGRVRYRGGIDSARVHLTDDARPYLRDALERLLAGGAPDLIETKTLGCALRRK